MTTVVTLGGSANAACLKCGKSILFFRGAEGDFISEVRDFPSDTVLQLECKQHGVFEVRAGDFHDRLN
jgi:hypothetical protein